MVKVSGPGGTLTTDATKPVEKGKLGRALPNGPGKTTYVLLSRPKSGTWKVTPQKGSTVTALRYAEQLPEPSVSGSTSGSSCAPTLRWKLKPLPGQKVMLVDQGAAGDTKVLSQDAKAKGSVKLTSPVAGVRYVRAIVTQGGGLREKIPLATYGGPGAPSGLKVKRAKKGLTVSWNASCGVSTYSVAVGKGPAKTVRGTSMTIAKAPKKGTVSVTSVVGGSPVGTATRPLAPGTS